MRRKTLILSTLLGIVGVVTSCGGGIDPDADWTIDTSATKSEVTLNTYFPDFGVRDNNKVQNGVIAQGFEELTGYSVTYNQLSSASADTQVQAILTGQEPVDMLKISATLFNNYVTDGYFTDLTDGIEKYLPNAETKAEITDAQWDAVSYNGKVYAIPEIGHTSMINVGLIWNMDHLEAVGITKIPETISEFDDAVHALQNHYGSNANYHALGLPGTNAEANAIAATFDMPKNWFENANGEIENALFSERTEAYLDYMNSLHDANILAQGWSTQVESTVMSNFVNGNCSVMNISYWNVTSLRQSVIASYQGFPSNVISEAAKTRYVYGVEDHEYGYASSDAMIQWQVYLRGDGTHGTNVQTHGKSRDSLAIAYYIVVPVASAKRAAYTLDWINEKLEDDASLLLSAGEENTHFVYTTSDDPDAVELITEEGETAQYAKITDQFNTDISGMSQYQTSSNKKIARKYWPLAEQGFDAWSVLATEEENIILDAFAVHPVLENFAEIDLLAQNYVITQYQNIINNGVETLENARNTYLTRYWTDTVKNEVNSWYKSSK